MRLSSWPRADKMAGQMRQRCFRQGCVRVSPPQDQSPSPRVFPPHGCALAAPELAGRPSPPAIAILADRRLPMNTPALYDEGDSRPLRTVCDLNESKAGSVRMTAV